MAKIYTYDDNGRRFVRAEVCNRCYDLAIQNGETEEQIAEVYDGNGQDRFSFGVYAGHFCADHWRVSGYMGSTPETADIQFDPDYAGETMEPEDY